jgi:hypothetical protein
VFDPEDFLSLADKLLVDAPDEATLSTVISQAYYAVFLSVLDRFGKRDAHHLELWRTIGRTDFELGTIGDRLRGLRNSADYGDSMPDLEGDAVLCVTEAHRPRSAAPNNSETLPRPPRGASPLCASSFEARRILVRIR